mmetsp:Transcript_25874/g.43183  ORF Transcript_25874/g.43183 Transcript_25874/m.43183 type:complete len:97 (+) Transcript_25874:248-538(+)
MKVCVGASAFLLFCLANFPWDGGSVRPCIAVHGLFAIGPPGHFAKCTIFRGAFDLLLDDNIRLSNRVGCSYPEDLAVLWYREFCSLYIPAKRVPSQ